VDYRNVKKDPAWLTEMLALSGGERRLPVIVDAGKVELGWKGRS
jgi:glutaredoxin 3